MDVTDFLPAFLSIVFNLLSVVLSFILAPVDLLINTFIPSATTAIHTFFDWVVVVIGNVGNFFEWFLYVLGISPTTWALFTSVLLTLFLAWILLFPIRLIVGIFKGL